MTKLSAEAFRQNAKLAQLLLRQNLLDNIEDGTFDYVTDLEWVDLGRNQLTGISSTLFAKNSNLRVLDLGKFSDGWTWSKKRLQSGSALCVNCLK